ncbi:MAG: hypothetical protein NWE96_05260 [Candidatus Bathyarchaeota archaeon]|nr:hypothetical protein [Candidatus Bathyarchaeota archaeon]
MPKNERDTKQSTLDKLPERPKDALEIIKATPDPIDITQIQATTKEEDELAVKISFKLPPKKAFSRVKANLWFDGHQISSVAIRILQGPLATEESEFSAVLDMRGVAAGKHVVTVEMFGLWDLNEKLSRALKETTINYVPQTRMSRLVKVPTVKSVAGADLAVFSKTESSLYEGIAENQKKEQLSKRDSW